MSDDYLWDRSGPPDPDVERLERMLGRLRTTAPALQIPQTLRLNDTVRLKADTTYDTTTDNTERWRTVRFLAPALAAASAIVLMVGITWQGTGPGASWQVASISGAPRIGSASLTGEGRPAVGQTPPTHSASTAPRQGRH